MGTTALPDALVRSVWLFPRLDAGGAGERRRRRRREACFEKTTQNIYKDRLAKMSVVSQRTALSLATPTSSSSSSFAIALSR